MTGTGTTRNNVNLLIYPFLNFTQCSVYFRLYVSFKMPFFFNFYFQVILFTYFMILFDWYAIIFWQWPINWKAYFSFIVLNCNIQAITHDFFSQFRLQSFKVKYPFLAYVMWFWFVFLLFCRTPYSIISAYFPMNRRTFFYHVFLLCSHTNKLKHQDTKRSIDASLHLAFCIVYKLTFVRFYSYFLISSS